MTGPMTPDVEKALLALVTYSWQDELRDFEQMTREGEITEGHVFRALVTLANFLDGTTYSAEDHIDV